jgi:hypothetical protein
LIAPRCSSINNRLTVWFSDPDLGPRYTVTSAKGLFDIGTGLVRRLWRLASLDSASSSLPVEMADDLEFDLDAAGLRADGAELLVGVEVLARKLEDALPRETTVRRRNKRLFGGGKVVESVEVRLGTTRYRLDVDRERIGCERSQEVRGVVIKREPLELADWVGALTAELSEQAADSAEARSALQRLVG